MRRPTRLTAAQEVPRPTTRRLTYPEAYAAYGGYSYDAANAIINALKTSLKDAKDVESARQATVDAVGKVSFDGVTGKIAFDQYGDTTSKVLTVYKVEPASGPPWRPRTSKSKLVDLMTRGWDATPSHPRGMSKTKPVGRSTWTSSFSSS